ncbi:hypothetical protein FDA09_11805 [Clostridium botulinum]|uniref:hypothetical protein n=1 Tax=Clostridium botulinum TaxID=1491 RepID=UPI0007749F57|nr:hypothetical protein [Clostridium botulinum]NFF80436.1 hypothetical protein [Clostridium botulinum]NFH80835.1 hypothetical protein [Clostridium botulinum]NFH83212.1 hypothetical protein [Clostridium botulinum]NFI12077.1 hypothetical protein [Clostridium botulinum]NFI15774.1 hypothetical protein [Clostridium botulinum]
MLDIKKWLETTELKVAETCFKKPPMLPYVVFTSNDNIAGADLKSCISNRDIIIELYSDSINRAKEKLIEDLLKEKSIEFNKNRTWIDSEKIFQTMYDFSLYEK